MLKSCGAITIDISLGKTVVATTELRRHVRTTEQAL